jgi:hypothetical protein
VSLKRRLVRFKPLKLRFAALAGLAVLATLAATSQASAVTLSGPWAPFTNCPVKDPAFVNYPPTKFGSYCVTAASPSGSLKIGSTIVQTGSTVIQVGLPGSTAGSPSLGFVVPASENKTIVTAPAQVPGGLLGLMCPSNVLLVSALCGTITNNELNNVTATAVLAGTPTDFSIFAGLTPGYRILTLPVKIQLQNPILGSSCYIGSDQEPIVLHPETTAPGAAQPFTVDPNGFQVAFLTAVGSAQADNTFAVPGTSGCGGALLSPVVDPAINLKEGLPSPAGKNEVVLNDVTSSLAITFAKRSNLIDGWKASCLTGC